MTKEQTAALVAENMKTIFAYALSRVSHKEDAEDLAGDIVLAILQSSSRIRDDAAFFGYIWALAANTYKKYLHRKSHRVTEAFDEEMADENDFTQELLKSEEFNAMRRELSLLSREYRECTVAYYFDGLSCAETASRLGISLEMVKYYLFKTRKLLKEGIQMEREFGTKSYNPAKFEFCTIFSDLHNEEYKNLFARRLPGNILVSAYYTPMTIRELSIELGVSSVYLEDEIALLERYQLLTALPGGKYQARLVIFTEEYRNEFFKAVENPLTQDVAGLLSGIRNRLPAFRALAFPGCLLEDDIIIWSILFQLTRKGWKQFLAGLGEEGTAPRIYGASTGINYGCAYDASYTDVYSVPCFAGYWKISEKYAGSYADFSILPAKNRINSSNGELTQSLKDMLAGSIEAPVPILDKKQMQAMEDIFREEIASLGSLCEKLHHYALSIMRVHAPENVASLLNSVLANTLLPYAAGLTSACAVSAGALSIPDTASPLGLLLYETT